MKPSFLLFCLVAFSLLATIRTSVHHQNHLKGTKQKVFSFEQLNKKKMISIPLIEKEQNPELAMKKINLLKQHQASLLQLNEVSLLQILDGKWQSSKVSQNTFLQSKSRSQMAQDNGIELQNVDSSYFTGQMKIGGMPFDMIFDSGSTLIFVNSDYCQTCLENRSNFYTLTETLQESDLSVSVAFGSGTISGLISKDTIELGNIFLKEGTFVQITKEQGDIFSNAQFDGIVGLTKSSTSEQIPSLVEQVAQNGLVDNSVYSFFLTKSGQGSEFTIGGVDNTKYDGEIKYHNLIEDSNFWAIPCKQIKVGGEDTNLCSEENQCQLVIDSGTSLFTGPPSGVLTILQTINKSGEGCKSLYDLPEISFVIEDSEYKVYPSEYIMTITEAGPEKFQYHSEIDKVIECVVGFYGLNLETSSKVGKSTLSQAGKTWIVGDAFMGKFYTVFDKTNGKIGIGKSILYSDFIHPQ